MVYLALAMECARSAKRRKKVQKAALLSLLSS